MYLDGKEVVHNWNTQAASAEEDSTFRAQSKAVAAVIGGPDLLPQAGTLPFIGMARPNLSILSDAAKPVACRWHCRYCLTVGFGHVQL